MKWRWEEDRLNCNYAHQEKIAISGQPIHLFSLDSGSNQDWKGRKGCKTIQVNGKQRERRKIERWEKMRWVGREKERNKREKERRERKKEEREREKIPQKQSRAVPLLNNSWSGEVLLNRWTNLFIIFFFPQVSSLSFSSFSSFLGQENNSKKQNQHTTCL